MAQPDSVDQEPLLNIKQAAALLNVSEVSLRRWTDAGRLACARVGARKERRFRRNDLLALLEEGGPPNSEASTRSRAGGIELEGLFIEHGRHLCTLYESDIGRLKLAAPFLAGGLKAGEICYLVAAPEAEAAILAEVKALAGDLARDADGDRLVVSNGLSSGRAMYAWLEEQFVRATRSGGRSLRLLGDMAWAPRLGFDRDELYQFETRYDHGLARRFAMVSLCQYDVRAFSGSGVLNALKCHADTFRFPIGRFLG